MSNEINKGWKYFFGISAVIGSIATVFMCVLAYLAPKRSYEHNISVFWNHAGIGDC